MQITSITRVDYTRSITQSLGFTLIEVLVAIVIFSIALLSLAVSQSFALVSIQHAMQRTAATQLSAQFIDIARLHRTLIQQGALQNLSIGELPSSNQIISESCYSDVQHCSEQAMLDSQILQWLDALARALPFVTVQLESEDNRHFQLKIAWHDKKPWLAADGSAHQEQESQQTLTSFFRL